MALNRSLNISCFRRDDFKDTRVYHICDHSSHYKIREVDGTAKGVTRISRCDEKCGEANLPFPNYIEHTILMLYF